MLDYKKIFSHDPYSMRQKKKDKLFLIEQKKLAMHHYKSCKEFKQITDRIFDKINKTKFLHDLPFIHAEMFKKFNLSSVNYKSLSTTLSSSGTSSSTKSKINLDKKTSLLQSRALSNIFFSFFKKKKTTIFFVDSPDVLSQANVFSARGAAIQGFKQLAKNYKFVLNKKYKLNVNVLNNFIKKNPKEHFIIFGFTSLVWKNFVLELVKNKIKLPKNNGILIHGGGWKKMKDIQVSKEIFNKKIKKIAGVKNCHNYYGMVEQTGSIFFECEYGKFHSSLYSEVFIRDNELKLNKLKKEGLIQVLSLLPLSYPGHNILTEDLGKIDGIDNCKCRRKGKYFSVIGRAANTENRGCSDVY